MAITINKMATKVKTKECDCKVIKLDSQIQAGRTVSYPISGYKDLAVRIRPPKNGLDAAVYFRHSHPITSKRPYMTLGQYPALILADYPKECTKLLAKRLSYE